MAAHRVSLPVSICNALRAKELPGIVDVCQSNASYQVWLDPDVIHPHELRAELEKLESEVGSSEHLELQTRIFELPVYYDDPFTHETLMRFRDRHQDPNATDLEYAARVNGLDSKQAFIDAHHSSPWICSMVGFVTGVPWLYQLVPRERQLDEQEALLYRVCRAGRRTHGAVARVETRRFST